LVSSPESVSFCGVFRKTAMATKDAQANEFYGHAERRIGWLTLLIGLAASAVVLATVSPLASAGVGMGTVLAWSNYRALEAAIDALMRVSMPEEGGEPSRVSKWVYAKFFARYALIGLVLYVMVTRLSVPILSLLGGLLALGAAAMAEAIYEIILGFE
jgi:hypothetical protein